MRKLTAITMVSLDGVMQAPGGPEEDTSGGFEHGGWVFPYFDEALEEVVGEAFSTPFEMVLGRRTYEIMAAHWPNTEDDGAELFNAAKKHVASHTLETLDWENSELLEGDAAEALAKLKEEDGPELQVHGSANLLQSLHGAGVIDEYRLTIVPIVLGAGKRLFEDGTPARKLEVVSSQALPNGVTVATYRPAGEPEKGSFALEDQ